MKSQPSSTPWMHICQEDKVRQRNISKEGGSGHLGEGEVADQLEEEAARGAGLVETDVDPTFAPFQVVCWVLGRPMPSKSPRNTTPHHTLRFRIK